MGKSGTRAIAVCDPDKNNMNRARDHVNQKMETKIVKLSPTLEISVPLKN